MSITVKRFVRFAALLLVCCAMLGCGKDNIEPQSTTTTIYGTVFNSATHEPVIGAEVEIGGVNYTNSYYSEVYYNSACHRFSSSVSGADGQYELHYGEVNRYDYSYIRVTCSGYDVYFVTADFNYEGGANYQVDINLHP